MPTVWYDRPRAEICSARPGCLRNALDLGFKHSASSGCPTGPGLGVGSLVGDQHSVLETLLAGAPQGNTPHRESLAVYKQCPLTVTCFLSPTLLNSVPFGRTKQSGQGSLGPKAWHTPKSAGLLSDKYSTSWSLKRCTRAQGGGAN